MSLPPSVDERAVLTAEVVVDTPLDRAFEYLVPEELAPRLGRGMRVQVEFGRRTMFGVCLGTQSRVPERALKPLIGLPDEAPVLTDPLLELGRFMADYYACSYGEALTAMLTGEMTAKRQVRKESVIVAGKPRGEMLAWLAEQRDKPAKRMQVLLVEAVLHLEGPFTAAHLVRHVGCSPSPLATAIKAGVLARAQREVGDETLRTSGEAPRARPELTGEQTRALRHLDQQVTPGAGFSVTLIQGVTGSGKTELYMRAIETVLDRGQSALVLLPEIALTPQTERVFTARFGPVAVLHSKITQKERRDYKQRMREGAVRLVIGARSALFAPVRDLGLIVVDEEHESSYKQDSTPRYQARDLAVMRAKIENCPALLGSATPSLESHANAVAGKYHHVILRSRVYERPLARVHTVDLRAEFAAQRRVTYLSRLLAHSLTRTLERREQALLFLNRRGFSAQAHCRACAHVLMCDRCSIALTYHKNVERLVCHYCYSNQAKPALCPACQTGSLQLLGIGTEKVEAGLRKLFGAARIARMDSDTMAHRDDYARTLNAFADGDIDLLVGTQMIVKGLDVPNVTLVGILNADASLAYPDFRAAERTFQLLTQVAGRAGRGDKPGAVIVQTFQPDHPIIRLAATQHFEAFADEELKRRRVFGYPPFASLLRLEVSGRRESAVRAFIGELCDGLRANDRPWTERLTRRAIEILGPAPAPMALLRDKVRWHALIKSSSRADIAQMVKHLKPAREKHPHGLTVVLDVDPYHLN